MNNSSNVETSNLETNITTIIQIPILLLIFLLAFGYITLILTQKTFRSNKLNWATINVCLATACFSLNQLVFGIIRLENLLIIPCRLQGFLIYMSAAQLMYAHSVCAFIRLLAIRYFTKLLFRSSRWLLINIIIGWIVGSLFAIPYIFYDGFACAPGDFGMFLKVYTCFTALLIPIHLVTICNMSIFRFIHQISRRVQDINNNKNNNNISRKRDAHVSKIMFLTFCLFVIGWTPIIFESLFNTADRHLPSGLTSFIQLLLPISLFGNMILLLYAHQPVRQLIKETFKCNGRILFGIKC